MDAISTATAGMTAATAQLGAAAAKVADPSANVDIVGSVIGQIEAELAFASNAKVVATAEKMIGVLLDITV